MISYAYHSLALTMLWIPLVVGPIWFAIYYFLCGANSFLPDIVKGVIALGVESTARVFSGEARSNHIRNLIIIDCIGSSVFQIVKKPQNFFYVLIAATFLFVMVMIPEWTRRNESMTTITIGLSLLFFGFLLGIF